MRDKDWYKRSYRRNLIDMHIEDWDESFLSQLDPKNYVKMLKIANFKSAMIYANSHVGYCYWPTKTGRMHSGIKGRDVLGEIIRLCHKEGIDVIVYYSLIFNNWAYEQNPEWRIVYVNGKTSREMFGRASRYGVCCPNSTGYRKFVSDQIEELCLSYDFEGIFFDMTFWPTICYCLSCKRRYKEETGEEDLPKVINWDDPSWYAFQKKREEWLADFAFFATSAVKKYKPEVAVEHQYSTIITSWIQGVTSLTSDHCDFVGGDFYGSILAHSFACKLYYNLTPNMPFDHHLPICYPGLDYHTMMKTRDLMEARALLTMAHNGAFLAIDAIDPVGTLDERRYRIVGEISKEIKKYENYLGGELCQDVAIYFSFNSKMNFSENNKKLTIELLGTHASLPHVEASLGAAEALKTNHIPFGVITDKNIKNLHQFQVVILPNVLRLTNEEAEAIKGYVAGGGTVYASKFTLKSKLSEILGVDSIEETLEKFTYITPTIEGGTLLHGATKEYPLAVPDSQIKAKFSSTENEDIVTMATITLPYTDPNDPSKFVSIHSNPPGISTCYPAIVCKNFGKGKIVWSSASIETYASQFLNHRSTFINIIRYLNKKNFSFEAIAPECVEIIQFHKPEEKRFIINIINFQSEIGVPNIPVHDILLKVKVKGRPLRIISLPDETPISFKHEKSHINIKVPKVKTFCAIALDYE
ncbi:MAG: alpha-L-fucosidase [Candidatus Bathyarchaeia archaeon]